MSAKAAYYEQLRPVFVPFLTNMGIKMQIAQACFWILGK